MWIELQWHTARWAPGVIRLVLDGMQPAKVPDQVIAEIRGLERGGLIDLPKLPGLKRGDQVRVMQGPFRDRLGLYDGQAPHERVAILLSWLGSEGESSCRQAMSWRCRLAEGRPASPWIAGLKRSAGD